MPEFGESKSAKQRSLGPRDCGGIPVRVVGPCLKALIFLYFASSSAFADQFDSYRKPIDCIDCYTFTQREKAIHDLENMSSKDVERNYLLGMLYFIQAVEAAKTSAQSKAKKPRIDEVMAEPPVRHLFEASEANYDAVERASPGYKFIYCKYGELYRFWHNERGLRRTTVLVGRAKPNANIQQCKGMLEDAAEAYTQYDVTTSKAIYEEAVREWKPYPPYMLEALGDIEEFQKNEKQAVTWWSRCVNEAAPEAKARCEEKRSRYSQATGSR